MVDQPDQRFYEIGFSEGIRTAITLMRTRGYDRALKALERMLENSQSRPPASMIETRGHDTTNMEA
ncbi:MAG: hypothetical protein M1468_01095 [Candidatus Thermoplasmatota archaeon]|jgi:hypothetical protein|nr:hypothetical protein [Candidatus Thermoplasmatota archaeon]MCL5441245.1 hypothetical protein [Candidatus Thermoplasmatota archaeon]